MRTHDPKDQPRWWLVILSVFLLTLLICESASSKRWYDTWNELFNHASY